MPRYKQTARWCGLDSGATPRWEASERASFESDVAKFLEHTDDSDIESHPQREKGSTRGVSFDSDTAESLDQLDDSDIESHPEEPKDLGKKASLTLPETRLHGTATRLSHRPLPIPYILSCNKWKPSTDSAVLKTEEKAKEKAKEKPKEKPKKERLKEEKPREDKPSFANQKHKSLSNLRFSLEVLQIVGLAAFCLWVLRCLAVLESRIASAEAGLESLGTDSSGNNGHFFLHFPLEVLHIAGLATFCLWVLRRLAELESRITAEAA